MIFQRASITNAGRDLIARATAGSTIIWGKCGCYSEDLNSATQGELNEKETLTGEVATGGASAVFEMEAEGTGRAKIKCQVSNESEDVSAGFAKTFGLWAKVQGDAEEVLVVIAVTGEHQPTYFPECTDATTRLIGLLDMTIAVQTGAASTISIISSLYALASDLQEEIDAREALAGRVMTCHKEGQATTGDDQTIYGKKTFENEMTVGAGVVPKSAGINVGSNTKKFEGMNANNGAFSNLACGTLAAETGGFFTLRDSILPIDTNVDLGADDAKFGAIHAENLNGVIPSAYTRSGATPGNDNPMIPKGSVIMINLIKSDSSNFASGVSACAGEIVSSSGGELADGTAYGAIKIAQYERGSALTIKNEYTTNASRGAISTGMRFKIICGCQNTSAADIITVLAMRIADAA